MIDLSGMKQNLSKLPERTEQALMAYGNTAAAKYIWRMALIMEFI